MSENISQGLLKIVWILSRLPSFGIQTFKRFRNRVSDLRELLDRRVLEAAAADLHLGADFVSGFVALLEQECFEKESDLCRQKGIWMLSVLDPAYPKNLAAIYDPPIFLYVRGHFVPEDQAAIGIVGTRHPSLYGARQANRFAHVLAECGLTIVSGLARGIDGEAHRGALTAKGRTIAVLGCGLDVIYPREHKNLLEQIPEHGAVVSEFPLGTEPTSFHFPQRNRIISGLSMGVLVVEASRKSGSLITASLAAEEGREVYAVPGPIDSVTSAGTNQLIQTGAKLVTAAENILEDLNPQIRAFLNDRASDHQPDSPPPVSKLTKVSPPKEEENKSHDDPILKLLAEKPLYFDEILTVSKLAQADLHQRLVEFEIQGSLKRDFGGRYFPAEAATKA